MALFTLWLWPLLALILLGTSLLGFDIDIWIALAIAVITFGVGSVVVFLKDEHGRR